MKFNKNISDVPLALCSHVLSYIYAMQSNNKQVKLGDINNHLGKTKAYVLSAINLLELVKVINWDNDFILIDTIILKEIYDDEKIDSTIIKHLTGLDPFIQYCTFLNKGKNPLESAKLVCGVYDISKNPLLIQRIFDKWIKLGNIQISKKSIPENVYQLSGIQRSSLEARIFLNDILGNNYTVINKNTIADFIEAITIFSKNPKKALNDLGRGLEDFLRVDFGGSVDLSKCNGIGQISTTLNTQKAIHSKHHNILTSLSSIRAMGDAHGIDKNSTERWGIETNSAFATILLSLQTINSMILFKTTSSLKL